MSVLFGDGEGAFAAAQALAIGPSTFPFTVAVADLSGDGQIDAVTANDHFTNTVAVLLGMGEGGAFPRQRRSRSASARAGSRLRT